MCYYNKLDKKAVELEKRFNAKMITPELFQSSELINGFSFPLSPVITCEKPGEIQLFNWGLIPVWAKDKDIRKNTLNARAETLTEKASFKLVTQNRCLVLSNGFYEWQWLDEIGKKKKKYLIHLPNHEAFAFGGIYSRWIDHQTGEELNTYAIVTTEAKGLMLNIHNSKKRMPIMLNISQESNWLKNIDLGHFLAENGQFEALQM